MNSKYLFLNNIRFQSNLLDQNNKIAITEVFPVSSLLKWALLSYYETLLFS